MKKHLEILSFYTCVPQMTILWCMVPETRRDEHNFLSFWTIFCPFTPPPKNLKNQNFEKMKKKNLEILSFNTSVLKIMIICYTVLEIWCVTDAIVSLFQEEISACAAVHTCYMLWMRAIVCNP